MFNSGSSFGSFGNTNLQQQTTPFGSGGFGSTANQSTGGLFGQSAASNPSGTATGIFGQPVSTAGTSGSGLFGSSSTNSTQPSSFGGFGSTNAANTSPFGQASTSGGGLFGKSATSTGFGGFGSTVGTSSTPSAFGSPSTTSMFGASTGNRTDAPGTAVAPFTPFTEKDTTKPGVTNSFEIITAMPQYASWSLEELRFADYKQNRRYGTGTGSAVTSPFGQLQTSPFGTTNANTSTFGSTGSPFGSSAQSNTGGLFGASSNTGSTFGQTNSTSPFGTNSQTSAFGQKPSTGLFGSTATNSSPFGSNTASTGFGANSNTSPFGGSTNTNTSGFGGFGQKPANTLGSAFGGFGSSNTTGSTSTFGQPAQSGGSLFGGASSNTNSGGSLFGGGSNTNSTSPFGQANANTNNSTGFSFGSSNANTTNKPAFSFGSSTQNAAGSSPFGQSNNANTSGSTGLFGQPSTTSSGFGQNTNTGGSTGIFGSTTSNTGGFGSATSSFGQPSTTTGGGSLFGQPSTAAGTTKPLFGGGFGASSTTPTSNNTTGSAFTLGAPKPSGGTLFGGVGSTPTSQSSGMSLFGATTASKPVSTTGTGLFGAKPTGSFGVSAPSSSTSLFGSANTNTQQQNSLFGGNAQTNTAQGGSLFGSSGMSSQNNNQLAASVGQNPYGSNPLFQSLNGQSVAVSGPAASPLVSGPLSAIGPHKKKKSLFSATKLAPKPLFTPAKPLVTSRALALAPTGSPSPRRRVSSASSITPEPTWEENDREPQRGSSSAIFTNSIDETILVSEAFSPHQSLRSLILDRQGGFEDGAATPRPGSPLLLTPNGHQEVNGRPELEVPTTPTPACQRNDVNGSFLHPSEPPAKLNKPEVAEPPKQPPGLSPKDEDIVDEHGYWISPSNEKLAHMSLKELESVTHFKVGRKGHGMVEFESPVDLTEFSNVLKQVAGRIVVFNNKSCAVYPDLSLKPPAGKGLNVNAVITLHGIYALTRDTKEPVKDPNHPLYIKHLNRLKNIPSTEFISWDVGTGDWTFRTLPALRENRK